MTQPVDEPASDNGSLKEQIEALLPHYYGPRDRQVWWKRRQLWLDGDYPQRVIDSGQGQLLLEKAWKNYHPDPMVNF